MKHSINRRTFLKGFALFGTAAILPISSIALADKKSTHRNNRISKQINQTRRNSPLRCGRLSQVDLSKYYSER